MNIIPYFYPLNMREDSLNITIDIIQNAKVRPGKAALVTADLEISYSELDRFVWISAQYLHRQGIRPGDVVALTFQSELCLCLALLGLARLGATSLTIPKSAVPVQRVAWELAARANFFITDNSSLFPSAQPTVHFDRNSLSAGRRITLNMMSEAPDTFLSIGIGSGTTGKPKLIPITHRQMRGRCAVIDTSIYHTESRALYFASLEFSSTQTLLFCLQNIGATFVLPHQGNLGLHELIHFSRRKSIDIISMSVYHTEQILQEMEKPAEALFSHLATLKISSSPISTDLRFRIKEYLTENLAVVFGTNECLSVSSARSPSVFEVPGTVGVPLKGIRVEIVDGQRAPVENGIAGMIRMKSPGLVDGYLNDADSTSKAFIDGWFYSGDLGKLTASGHLIYLGRSDDMMIYNGINIYPGELEMCLSAHPAVADVVAFPLQHQVHQHLPACAISLKEFGKVSGKDLSAYALAHLGVKAPHRVFCVDEIPRNEQGKVVRSRLFEKIKGL